MLQVTQDAVKSSWSSRLFQKTFFEHREMVEIIWYKKNRPSALTLQSINSLSFCMFILTGETTLTRVLTGERSRRKFLTDQWALTNGRFWLMSGSLLVKGPYWPMSSYWWKALTDEWILTDERSLLTNEFLLMEGSYWWVDPYWWKVLTGYWVLTEERSLLTTEHLLTQGSSLMSGSLLMKGYYWPVNTY